MKQRNRPSAGHVEAAADPAKIKLSINETSAKTQILFVVLSQYARSPVSKRGWIGLPKPRNSQLSLSNKIT